jgi:hypothetical protein
MLRYLSIGALMLSSATAMAEGPSYSYIQANYQEVDIDVGGGFDVDGDGFGVSGSLAINDNWFIFAGYSSLDFESVVDLTEWSLGGGWNSAISEKTDWFATAAYIDAEIDIGGFDSASDSGFGVSVGMRSMLTPKLELAGSVGYADLGDGADGTSVSGGLWYAVAGSLALGVGFDVGEDTTGYGVGIRLYFDK